MLKHGQGGWQREELTTGGEAWLHCKLRSSLCAVRVLPQADRCRYWEIQNWLPAPTTLAPNSLPVEWLDGSPR